MGKGKDKVIVQSGSDEDTATVTASDTTESLGRKSGPSSKGKGGLRDEEVQEPRPNTPSGFHEYPNPIKEKENLVKAKALVEECQTAREEPGVQIDIKFPPNQKYPTSRAPVKVPSIIAEVNEDHMSNDEPLLMDRMFDEDPAMERLRHEGLHNPYDNLERQSDGITVPGGPRDVAGLAAFLSMEVKMPIASLLRGNPTLWHDLSDWMNGHLDPTTDAQEENWTREESNSEEDTQMVPINKLGQYFESDDSNAVIPISYHQRKVEAILDGGAGVSIMTK